jgi:signal transduction histidine kinase
MYRYALILFFILLSHIKVLSQDLKPHIDFTYKSIGKQVTYLEDKNNSLTLEQAKAAHAAGQFQPGRQDILNLGNTQSAFWIKINYQNTGPEKVYLVVDIASIEHIDCYAVNPDGSIKHMKSGSIAAAEPGVVITNNFVFELSDHVVDSVPEEIYLRVRTNNYMMVPLKIATADTIMKGQSFKERLEYIYIGILLGLLLFNFFLYLSLKDDTYLYYSLYILTLTIYQLFYLRGYGYLVGEDLRIMLNHYPHVFLSTSVITSLVFCRKFLNLEQTVPGMVKVFHFLMVCALVLFLTSITGQKSFSASITQLLGFTTAIVSWIAGIMAYRRGHKPAKYYIVAWFFLCVMVIIVTLSLWGILQFNEFTLQLVAIGSTIELLLLSFALGDRYKLLIKAEREVRDENLALVQNQNLRLESLVQKRTELLSETIEQLESSNAVKNKLFSIIGHDLRSPFNSLISILSLSDMDMLTFEELKFILKENRKNIENIYNTLNNLLYWAKSQMDGITVNASVFDLKTLIDELILVYLPLIQKKEIDAQIEVKESHLVYADENQITLILRNLIDNAIKFTPNGQKLGVELTKLQDSTLVCIRNTVSDVSSIDVKDIMEREIPGSTNGTETERGIGLGLLLCREYVNSNGGEFTARLEEDTILFCFSLPNATI